VTKVDRKRILLADDQDAMLDKVNVLLKEEYEIVGRVADGVTLVAEATRLKPDLIISDISMPGMTGFEAAVELRKLSPAVPLIFLTVQSSPAYLKKARALGVSGYVLKVDTAEQLPRAIKEVLGGGSYFPPRPTSQGRE
jgi:DNA-binding NarL/FixJ family response regulator